MKLDPGGTLHLAPTDLSNHLACRHLTTLELAVARGELERPHHHDPSLELLWQRGKEHERAYVEHLQRNGQEVLGLNGFAGDEAGVAATVAAMRAGVDVVVQGWLASGRWRGRPDLLVRVEEPTELGAWGYEAADTKLARETKGTTILQLCAYSELIAAVQGRLPGWMHVVTPGVPLDRDNPVERESFEVRQYLAYHRLVKRRLEEAVGDGGGAQSETYPDPVPHCDICRWWPVCNDRRHRDDHLSLVADIRRLQVRELQGRGVGTLEALAGVALPLAPKPERGAPETWARIREQARVQLEGRQRRVPVHELLPLEPGRGLGRLPEPSPGDVFLDLEGDPYVGEGGLEYLFGWAVAGEDGRLEYRGLWALDPAGEKLAFETFLDQVAARRARWPDLHVYHFAPYEPAALKRLMGRHATREEALDRMLRAELFVDLHAVAKQSVRASVERYGLKELEAFTGFTRELPLEAARSALREAEWALELGRPETLSDEARRAIESYNRDDCLSAWALRDWLEGRRAELVAGGAAIERPTAPGEGEPSEKLRAWQERVNELKERLQVGVPADPEARSDEERARFLLAHTLEWFRRENNVAWWDFFRLQKASPEDLFDEPTGAAGLRFVATVGGTANCPIHRYEYAPEQDVRIKSGDIAQAGEVEIGTVEAIEPAARTLDIRKRAQAGSTHPEAVFGYFVVRPDEPEGALLRLADEVTRGGIEHGESYRAARALLLRRPPAPEGTDLVHAGETAHEAALRLALDDDVAVLPIQGPPGSGKTYTAARMACELVRTGKKVGISAMSHKVIRHLLEKIGEAAAEQGITVQRVQKVKSIDDDAGANDEAIRELTENKDMEAALARGEGDVFAGTAWLWAREQVRESVDVLIVDEAGQMSLALALAASQGGRRLVLVGDPQQLEQPLQGSHPDGTAVSALEHLLGATSRDGRRTLEPHQGLFLEETRRLPPAICEFTSELFYDARLRSRRGLEGQALAGGPIPGAGLWFLPVEHAGNQSESPEEAEEVARLVGSLTDGTVAWVDRKGERGPLALEDILIVAPYNLQVEAISRRLPAGARVGTVDRFQGQEAAVVLFSTATSTPEDAPRGMEFLYSPNRLNVATSRARCACVLVGSPRLFEPECRTPRQMRLANAFCRYLELARVVGAEFALDEFRGQVQRISF